MGVQSHSGFFAFSANTDMPVKVNDCGIMAYSEALAVQKATVENRAKNSIPDTLMLLEHPPTYTLGLRANKAHLLVPESELKNRHIKIFQVDRGGDITFHGPGQLVGYPVLDLKARKLDAGTYIDKLERVIIKSIAEFGVSGYRVKGFPGVWTENQKIASIGVKVNTAGISCHGFAVNVNTDLSFFQDIVPCGLRGVKITSLKQITGVTVEMHEVKQAFAETFLSEFE